MWVIKIYTNTLKYLEQWGTDMCWDVHCCDVWRWWDMQWVPVRYCWDIERAGLQSGGSQQEQCRGSPHFSPATELICSKAPRQCCLVLGSNTGTCFSSADYWVVENLLAIGSCLCLGEEHRDTSHCCLWLFCDHKYVKGNVSSSENFLNITMYC